MFAIEVVFLVDIEGIAFDLHLTQQAFSLPVWSLQDRSAVTNTDAFMKPQTNLKFSGLAVDHGLFVALFAHSELAMSFQVQNSLKTY